MVLLSVNTPKSLLLSTPFLPTTTHLLPQRPPLTSSKPLNTAVSISAIIIPPNSSVTSKQQQVYQPFRPPPSPLPSRFRSLDTNERLDILTNRLGLWFEYAPLITALYNDGFISTTLEEITGIASLEQNRLVVAAQVRDSLVETADKETLSFFDSSAGPELLYAIRILNAQQRAVAARFIIDNDLDGKKAEELARSMKDYPRRDGERGYESFDGNLPGDCLAFMYFRQALEHRSASLPELSKSALERALEVAETEKAKERVVQELEAKDKTGTGEENLDLEYQLKVPVVRMAFGEVAESSVVLVFPVCRAELIEAEVEEAPWECGMIGEFGMVQAEKGWSRWVVLPGWAPVASLRRGGVAVAFPRARGILPWKSNRKYIDEEILVVADRGRKEVEFDKGFYLVARGSNGSGREGLIVESGSKLKEIGVAESLGTVVLVVRPPRDDFHDQISDEDWD